MHRLILALFVPILMAVPAFSQNGVPPEQPVRKVIEKIQDPKENRSGISKIEFDPATYLSETYISKMPLPNDLSLLSYDGEWKNGLAEGMGTLRFADSVSYSYGSINLAPKEVRTPNFYVGTFKEGVPNGEGSLRFQSSIYGPVIDTSGLFSDQVEVTVASQKIAVVTALDHDKRILVRLMQYINSDHKTPSRMFFGEVVNGAIKGEWIDVPWYHETESFVSAGYGPYVDTVATNENVDVSCSHTDFDRWELPSPEIFLGMKGPFYQELAGKDPRFGHGAKCTVRTPQGWFFDYDVVYRGIFVDSTPTACRMPDGKQGKLKNGGTYCEERRAPDKGLWDNIRKTFERAISDTILRDGIDKGGDSIAKTMCRATGTEVGKNCNIGFAIGASWPIGDEPSTTVPANEEVVRQSLIADRKRATKIRQIATDSVSEMAAVTAEMNAVCHALCTTKAQREFSNALLTELETASTLQDENLRIQKTATIARETASVLSAGLRVLAITGPPLIAFYKVIQSTRQDLRLSSAYEAAAAMKPTNDRQREAQYHAKKIIDRLHIAHMQQMTAEGATVVGAYITAQFKGLKGLSEPKARALSTVIQLYKTKKQIDAFVEKYKDIKDENELYDALIADALEPLGIEWPLRNTRRN